MMTCVQPASLIIATETAPVKAPDASKWTSCAASSRFPPLTTSATGTSHVNGGAISTSRSAAAAAVYFTARASVSASPSVVFIFQLPAMSGFLRAFMQPPARAP